MRHYEIRAAWIGIVLAAAFAWVAAGASARAQNAGDFKDAAAIWKQVQEHVKHLDQVIADKKLDQVHEAAFAVRDAAKMLPAKSKALTADQQAKLATGVRSVGQIAALLDKYGDANDLPNTQAQQKKLHTILDAIEGLYPAGALK